MNQTHFNLETTQKLLWKLIVAPEGVEKALKKFPVSLPLQGDARLSTAERLDIYANMYFFRILDSLKEDFAAVLKILGDDLFHNLVTDYLIKHPPSHWSLRYAGQYLPSFLKAHSKKRWPYLYDLARLEWALLEAFDAPDAPILTSENLSCVETDQWMDLRFKLASSARIISFRWKVDQIREGILKGKKVKEVRSSTALLIWRRDLKVFYRPLENLEKRLLEGLENNTFGEICGIAAKALGQEQAAPLVTSYLRIWLKEQLLRGSIPQ